MNKTIFNTLSLLLLGGLVARIIFRAARQGNAPQPKVRFHPSQHFDEGVWDRVDEASWESFPASDPPSHSPPPTQDKH